MPKDTSSLFHKVVLGCKSKWFFFFGPKKLISLFILSDHHICKSRGQNPNIGAELEKMLSKHSNIKIVQSDYRTCDMS